MITEAYIAGQIGKAIFREDGRYYLLAGDEEVVPRVCTTPDLMLFRNSHAEVETVETNLDLAGVRARLKTSREQYSSLFLCLNGLDADLSDVIRIECIAAVDEMMQDEAIHAFVRHRLLGRPIPSEADVEGAARLSKNTSRARALYKELINSREAITAIRAAWETTAQTFIPDPEARLVAEKTLIDEGAFAEMVTAIQAGNRDRLDGAVVRFGARPELAHRVHRLPHLLNALTTYVLDHHSSGLFGETGNLTVVAGEDDEMWPEEEGAVRRSLVTLQNKERRSNWRRRGKTRKGRVGDETHEQVKKQIAVIEELLQRGLWSKVRSHVRDLLEYQALHSEKHHVVKTLCALAKHAIDRTAFELAEEWLDYARDLGVNDVVVETTNAELLKEMGSLNEALSLYRQTALDFPTNVVARTGQAEVLKEMGRLDDALTLYRQAAQDFPSDVVARTGQAEVLRGMGRLDDALKLYKQVAQDFPSEIFARTGQAEVLRGMGRLDDALALYQRTAQDFPSDVVSRNGQAEVLKEMGRLKDALKLYQQTEQNFPSDIVARTGQAGVLKDMGRLEDALKLYEQTEQNFPSSIFARTGQAGVLREMGRLNDALMLYHQIALDFPSNVVVRCGQAEVLKEMGRLDDALSLYQQIAQIFPSDIVARNGQAEVLKEMGRLDDALSLYQQIAQIFPSDVVARNGQAEVLKEMGRLDDALSLYQQIAQIFPSDLVARNGRANLLLCLGSYREARSLLHVDEPVSLQDWIGYHILAMSFLREGDLKEALERLRYGLQRVPWPRQRPYFAIALGVAKMMQRQFEEAVSILQSAGPPVRGVQKQTQGLLLAHAQAELNRNAEARNGIAEIGVIRHPQLFALKTDLVRRYNLNGGGYAPPTAEEIIELDNRIQEREFAFALAA